MNIFKSILTFLILFCFLNDANAGDIKGKVKYVGSVGGPLKTKQFRLNADPVCGQSHPSGKASSEKFKINSKGELAECIVYLRDIKYSGGVPETSVELDQKGCIYTPHVFGIQAGQELLIKNSDETLHNIHSMPKENKEFNFAMPRVLKQKPAKFDKAEDPFYIKCDVHPWMKTWVLVSDHPYYAVTDENGNYEIKDVPAGTYEVVCWQEIFNLKKKRAIVDKITVGSKSVTKDFTFSKPKKK